MSAGYKLVKLANGVHSVHSLAHQETFHPVIGPVAEAEALYVRQLELTERLQRHRDEFVIWDVGLGAAANALTVLRETREIKASITLVSFDNTLEPLKFALEHRDALAYLAGYEVQLEHLLRERQISFANGKQSVNWQIHLADFPTLISQADTETFPKPHAIMFDAFSPAKNPAMWTEPLFANIFRLLDSKCPCALPTYSRSTMLRVTLLLAGFFVGVGHATGEKEETTIAANTLNLIKEPLDSKWLQRAHRSGSAEPMWEPVYRQAKLSVEIWEKLRRHPQFLRLESKSGYMSDFIRRKSVRDRLQTILSSQVVGFKNSPDYRDLREYELEIPGVVCSAFAKYFQRLHEEQMQGDKTEATEKAIQSAHNVLNSLASSREADDLIKDEFFENLDCTPELLIAMRQRMGPDASELFDKYNKQ